MGVFQSLRSGRDFRRIMRGGARHEFPLFRIFIARNSLNRRLAVVISRAIEKRAVVRNRLRRRAREWLRVHAPLFPVAFDMVIIFKRPAVTAPRNVLYEALSLLLPLFAPRPSPRRKSG